MSYGRTMIQDLPELSDIESSRGGGGGDPSGMGPKNQAHSGYSNGVYGQPGPSPPEPKQLQKVIRATHRPPNQSGMEEHYSPPPPPPQQQSYGTEIERPTEYIQRSSGLPCLDIADHVSGCPICSKLYNTDKTIYMVIIVLLGLICLLLLKKVLNV